MAGSINPVRFLHMNRKSFKHLVVILIMGIIFIIPVFEMFTITDAESGRIVYAIKTSEISEFHTEFIHSVNKKSVFEYYRIQKKQFVVYKTKFYSFGAGMPNIEDYGVRPYIKEGMVHIDSLNIVMDSFSIFVGTIANHSISFNNKTFKLSQFVKPGKSALFSIEKVSFCTLLRVKML